MWSVFHLFICYSMFKDNGSGLIENERFLGLHLVVLLYIYYVQGTSIGSDSDQIDKMLPFGIGFHKFNPTADMNACSQLDYVVCLGLCNPLVVKP